MLDDLYLQIHLAPRVHEKHAATSFERFRGWLVRHLRPKWLAVVVVWMDRDKPPGHHSTSDLLRLQLGSTRAPDLFLSVTFTIFTITHQRFVLRGKARVILRRLKLHGQNVPKTASPRHCEKIVLWGDPKTQEPKIPQKPINWYIFFYFQENRLPGKIIHLL